jgi:hypothetical protein
VATDEVRTCAWTSDRDCDNLLSASSSTGERSDIVELEDADAAEIERVEVDDSLDLFESVERAASAGKCA